MNLLEVGSNMEVEFAGWYTPAISYSPERQKLYHFGQDSPTWVTHGDAGERKRKNPFLAQDGFPAYMHLPFARAMSVAPPARAAAPQRNHPDGEYRPRKEMGPKPGMKGGQSPLRALCTFCSLNDFLTLAAAAAL